jgi:hypothetical protein
MNHLEAEHIFFLRNNGINVRFFRDEPTKTFTHKIDKLRPEY